MTRWAFWLVAALVGVLALDPTMPAALPNTGWDKANHLLAFAVMGLLVRVAYRRHSIGALVCLIGYGALIEVAQSFTPSRQSEWGDLAADALGLVLAHLLGMVLDQAPLRRSVAPLLGLPRAIKRGVALSTDALLCVFASWLAVSLRLESWVPLSGAHSWAVVGSLVLALPLFVSFGLYRAVFRYNDRGSKGAVRAWVLYALLYAGLFAAIGVDGVPRTVGLTQPPLLLLGVAASRMLARRWLGGAPRVVAGRATLPNALIYGAGCAGQQLATAMVDNTDLRVLGYLDDDRRLHGGRIGGLDVYSPDTLPGLLLGLQVTTVLLAMPSAPRKRRKEIIQIMLRHHVTVRTLPGLKDLAQGQVLTSDLRTLEIDDLLGRDAVAPDRELLTRNVAGKVVMVTGAGGSIGSELCRQLIRTRPKILLLVELNEFALYAIHHELLDALAGSQGAQGAKHEGARLVPLLASVREHRRMREIMETWRPHTVYHAAAYKHVPLVEHNAAEGVKNNVFGTLVIARVAADCGVDDFVLVSTDKAVRPTNIMGATKRVAEMALQAFAAQSARRPGGTRFCMVRFGNVLGSSGSVVPLFRRQIREGGPITLTHTEITRYFMTIPEAAQLVIQAGAMGTGGDVFVLDMGEPVKIVDLARRMVELSGLTICDDDHPEGDITIRVTGLRPGEKLYEELLIGNNPLPTGHPRILKAHELFLPWEELAPCLQLLSQAVDDGQVLLIRDLLRKMVGDYNPDVRVVDWVYTERQSTKLAAQVSAVA